MIGGWLFVEYAILFVAILMLVYLIYRMWNGIQTVNNAFSNLNTTLSADFQATQNRIDVANRTIGNAFNTIPGAFGSSFSVLETQVEDLESNFNTQLAGSLTALQTAAVASENLVPAAILNNLDAIGTSIETNSELLYSELFSGSSAEMRLTAFGGQLKILGQNFINALEA